MCRSMTSLAIWGAITAGILPLSLILLLVDDRTFGDDLSCPATASDVCAPCNTLSSTDASVVAYIVEHELNLTALQWRAPSSPKDFAWFMSFICRNDNKSMALRQLNASSSNMTIEQFGACCCGASLDNTDWLACPSFGFQVSTWSWWWFVAVIFSANGVALVVLGYIFLTCGCIEPSKGALEMLAEDMQQRYSAR